MLTVKKDDFDENIDDIMKSINKMLENNEGKNKKEKEEEGKEKSKQN